MDKDAALQLLGAMLSDIERVRPQAETISELRYQLGMKTAYNGGAAFAKAIVDLVLSAAPVALPANVITPDTDTTRPATEAQTMIIYQLGVLLVSTQNGWTFQAKDAQEELLKLLHAAEKQGNERPSSITYAATLLDALGFADR